MDNDDCNADAITLSIVLAASKPLNHDNHSDNGKANAKDAPGKRTLVSNATSVGNDGGNADTSTLSIILAVRWWWRWLWRWR